MDLLEKDLRDLGRVRAPEGFVERVLVAVGVVPGMADSYAQLETPLGALIVAWSDDGISAGAEWRVVGGQKGPLKVVGSHVRFMDVRTIEVLIDRDAVASGAATTGQPWQHYDLGHGYCAYSFFEQCPHRMACAKCDFYTPKASSKALLLEAKDNLQRMLAAVPLTDDERAAVDDGHTALDQLLQRLADVPTPAGPTPRQIMAPATATILPIADVRQGPSQTTTA